jgi:Kef-type K+ transport system membrane component KefB
MMMMMMMMMMIMITIMMMIMMPFPPQSGLDAIFGAFMFGVALPRDAFTREVVRRNEEFVHIVLLPLVNTHGRGPLVMYED